MTTSLMETTASSPSLRERLVEIIATERRAEEARREKERAAQRVATVNRLTTFVTGVLGMTIDANDIHDLDLSVVDSVAGFDVDAGVAIEIDGIRLESYPRWRDLYVALRCERCGATARTGYVRSLTDIAGAVYAFERHVEQCPGLIEKAPVVDPIEQAIANLEARGVAWGDAESYEQQLADDRALEKQAAILRIMQTTNPLTSKQHSASSADAVVEQDAEYRTYRQKQSDAVVKKFTAKGQFEAAKLRAERLVQREKAAR